MAKKSREEVQTRLLDPTPLTRQDVSDLIPHIGAIEGGLVWRIFADLGLQNIEAVQKFDRSSSKLSIQLFWLTWVIAVLTLVIAVAAVPVIHALFK